MAENKEELKKGVETLADLIGMGIKEVYKMFAKQAVAQGLVLIIIALLFGLGAVLLAVGVVMPVWSWILLAVACVPLVLGVLLLANPAYHALNAILDRVKKR